MAVTDLIDPDPVEGVEPAGIKQLGHTAVDDRGHRFPGAAQQGGHRGAVGPLSKPGSSDDRETIAQAYDELEAAQDRVASLSTNPSKSRKSLLARTLGRLSG